MTRRSGPAAFILASLAALALPSVAAAQGPQPPPAPAPAPAPPAAQQPRPAAAPPIAKGTLKLTIERAQPGRVLVGDQFNVRGVVRPYVAGQQVVVRIYRDGRKLAALRAPVFPAKGNRSGYLRVSYSTSRPGRLTIRGSHRATAAQRTFRAGALRLSVDPYAAGPGARGRVVRVLQQRLGALGYVVGRRGLYDDRTARAVIAFRKVVGLPRTALASPDVFARLARGQGAFRVRFPGHGKHVEADLSRQVLALIRGDKVQRIYPTSSGAPGTPTVHGTFRVYRKDPGTNAKGMVRSSYFIGGYAIHGYPSVPVFNASHGCLRVAIPDSLTIFRWLGYGDVVDVYA